MKPSVSYIYDFKFDTIISINAKMQVSIWEKESFYAPKDVIIIGSGLAGLWTALYLKKKKPGISITIVDRGIIPTGASTRNAGFACFGSLTELLHDAATNGEDKMLSLVEMRYRGLQRIQKVFGKKQIDFDLIGGYELFTKEDNRNPSELEEKMEGLNKLLKPVVNEKNTFRLADKKIKRFGFDHITHLAENKAEGYLHSGKLCQALLKEVQGKGVSVLSAVEITGFEKTGELVSCYTNQHITLQAAKVVVQQKWWYVPMHSPNNYCRTSILYRHAGRYWLPRLSKTLLSKAPFITRKVFIISAISAPAYYWEELVILHSKKRPPLK
jgi:hypothetical protein